MKTTTAPSNYTHASGRKKKRPVSRVHTVQVKLTKLFTMKLRRACTVTVQIKMDGENVARPPYISRGPSRHRPGQRARPAPALCLAWAPVAPPRGWGRALRWELLGIQGTSPHPLGSLPHRLQAPQTENRRELLSSRILRSYKR